jgi:hypothetical protein
MSLAPPIPESGLAEVLGTWAGRGYIWDALAVPQDVQNERSWNRKDLLCRAHRILLERLAPNLALWPTRLSNWIDLLPAARTHARAIQPMPFSGVNWVATRSRFGWPPNAFLGRETERGADMLLVTSLRWTLEQLATVRSNAVRAYPDVDLRIRPQLDAAFALLDNDPVLSAIGVMPGRPELMALIREGSPWGSIAAVAEEFRSIESSVTELAWRMLLPDDGIRWRLFHLGVLGVLLSSLRNVGCTIRSLRPFGSGNRGPAYRIEDSSGRTWDLWFEASEIWSYEEASSPYVEATRAIPGAGRPIGADLLLICPGASALILECKYSADPTVVARDGYYQASTYAAEVRSCLAKMVTSVVVGPEGVILSPSFTQTVAGEIGTLPPSGLQELVKRFLDVTAILSPDEDLPTVFIPSA